MRDAKGKVSGGVKKHTLIPRRQGPIEGCWYYGKHDAWETKTEGACFCSRGKEGGGGKRTSAQVSVDQRRGKQSTLLREDKNQQRKEGGWGDDTEEEKTKCLALCTGDEGEMTRSSWEDAVSKLATRTHNSGCRKFTRLVLAEQGGRTVG